MKHTINDETRRRIALKLGPITTARLNRKRKKGGAIWRIITRIIGSDDFRAII